MKKAKVGFIGGALILSVGVVLSKALGAFYRVPLMNLLKPEGMGIYQLVFPLYCILLTLSSTGIPTGLCKLIAEGAKAKKVLYKSIIVFGAVGLVGSAAMFFAAEGLALLQGNALAALAYKALSPSVFAVSIISCFRGYYQGKLKMLPTAVSQLTEQAVKLSAGLLFCYFFGETLAQKAALAALAVTLSEIAALIYLVILLKKDKPTEGKNIRTAKILKVVFPITLTALLLPIGKLVDSFTVLNIIGRYSDKAISLYGLYTGGVESIIGVPIAVCYGLAISGLPRMVGESKVKNIKKVLLYTTVFASIASLAVYFFAPFVVKLLYGGLNFEEQGIMIRLICASSLQVLFMSVLQASAQVLVALNKLYRSLLSLTIGLSVKVGLTFLLVPIQSINIFGAAISDIFFYLVAAMFNLLYIISAIKKEKGAKNSFRTFYQLKKSGLFP